MKLAIVLAVVVATANALSQPDFDLFKTQVQKTQMQAAKAFDWMRDQHRVVLMSNSSEPADPMDEMCKMFDKMSTQSKCAAYWAKGGNGNGMSGGMPMKTATQLCKCTMMPMLRQIKPLLDLQCGDSECKAVFESMNTKDGSSPDFTALCSKRSCITQLFGSLRVMSKSPSTPKGCPVRPVAGSDSQSDSSDGDDMEKGLEAMTDGMNFFCAKNVKGDFCGNTFEAVGKSIQKDCSGNFNDSSCVCGRIAGGGCCLKSAYDFFQLHDKEQATEFADGFSGCGYDIESMATCASNKKKKLKFIKQQLGFKGIACGKKKEQVAFIVQQLVADKAKVNIGNVGVTVDSCPCCNNTSSRRLLATGKLETTVSITGNDVDTAATNLNKAVDDGSMTDAELGGSVDKSATTQAKVSTQESDLPTGDEDAPAGRFAPSIFVAVVIAVMATLF